MENFAVTEYDAHLVTINDASENSWLLSVFGDTYWIGLHFSDFPQDYVWVSGEPVSYTNWSGTPLMAFVFLNRDLIARSIF